jgi:hypothetical protein
MTIKKERAEVVAALRRKQPELLLSTRTSQLIEKLCSFILASAETILPSINQDKPAQMVGTSWYMACQLAFSGRGQRDSARLT